MRLPLPRSALVEAQADARVALLEGLIDHAPLFPPASLGLADALEEDRRARESAASFALARFVCPASMVHELPEWERELSVVVDRELGPEVRFAAVETPFRDDLESLAEHASEVYVEVPLDGELEERLDTIAALGLRAKVRCGGATVPGADDVAAFLRGCRARGLPFKATAGLHHAVRSDGQHGFLNLLAATLFGDEEAALGDDEPDAFVLSAERFGWRGRTAGAVEIARMRSESLCSIGSCSFFEPMEELEALGVLPPGLMPPGVLPL